MLSPALTGLIAALSAARPSGLIILQSLASFSDLCVIRGACCLEMDTRLLYWCRLFNTQRNEALKLYNNNLEKSIFRAMPNHKLLQIHIT